jgi:teichuronic acid biosynthesis glycosyltransferase TuaG
MIDVPNLNNRVSIITPIYNSEEFIVDTIESVISQSYKNWELIIIDDCSTDNSLQLIQKYIDLDERISLFINKENSGAAVSRNLGLKKSSGNFICFIDSDDLWNPLKLETQLNFMLNNNFAISFTSYNLIDENGNSLNKVINSIKEINYEGYLKNTIIGMSTSMIDTEKTGVFEFVNIRTRQDTYLWITLLKRGLSAHGLNMTLASYRVRKDSISANKLNAAKRVWYLYYNLENLGLLKSIYYFSFYVVNAIKKRIL